MKKQIALIGVTGFGASHLFHLLNLAEAGIVDIAAAVVINPEQAAESLEKLAAYNPRIYPDADTFFAAEKGKIDLVCLPVGIAAHELLTLAALAANMNVLVEKPASGSVASVERMIAAEKASGKFVAVGYQNGYAPEIHFLKRLLLSKRLGDIRYSAGIVCWPRNDDYYQRNFWAAKRSVNGIPVLDSPLNNACAHYINLLLFLNGAGFDRCAEPVKVTGEVLRARPDIEMFDACDADYTLDNGTSCRIMLAHCCTERVNPILKIVCERGTILWHGNAAWSVTDHENNIIASGIAVHPGETMFRTVISRLDDPSQTVYTLENALAQTRAVELLDQHCPITPAAAEYTDGFYAVPGLTQKYLNIFER